MVVHFWLRAETKPLERRTHLTPEKCKELVDSGFKVTVERSNQRIFKDKDYESISGVEIVPLGSWQNAPKDAIILGLKELPLADTPIAHQHVYFAHAYKHQMGAAQLLQRFHKGGGSILDIEFMTDEKDDMKVYKVLRNVHEDTQILQDDLYALEQWSTDWQLRFNTIKCEVMRITKKNDTSCPEYHLCGNRLNTVSETKDLGRRSVAVFSPIAGATGMALGVAAWCYQHLGQTMPGIKPFESEQEMIDQVKSLLKKVADKKGGVSEIYPTVLVMGALGRCGHGALDVARKLGIPECNQIKWDMEETKGGGPFPQILKYDIFVNCILLMKKIPPFLTLDILDTDDRNLTLVVDVSCDVNSPNNPLPFYDSATTPLNPVRAVDLSKSCKTLEILSIDLLPSFLPQESSIRFADNMMPYLKRLTKDDPDPAWIRTKKVFEEKVQELCS